MAPGFPGARSRLRYCFGSFGAVTELSAPPLVPGVTEASPPLLGLDAGAPVEPLGAATLGGVVTVPLAAPLVLPSVVPVAPAPLRRLARSSFRHWSLSMPVIVSQRLVSAPEAALPSRFMPPGAALGSAWLPAGALAGGLPWG